MYEGSGPHPIRMPERFYGELLAPTPTISASDGLRPRRTRDAPTAIPCLMFFFLFCFVLFWSYQLFDSAAELCECAFPFWFWWHLGRDLRIIHPIICRITAAASDPRRTLRACQVGNIHNIPQKSKPKNIICYENRKVNIIIYVHHYTYTWQTVQRVEGSSTCVALYRSCTTIKNTHQVKGRLPVVRFFFFFFKGAAAEEEKANNI